MKRQESKIPERAQGQTNWNTSLTAWNILALILAIIFVSGCVGPQAREKSNETEEAAETPAAEEETPLAPAKETAPEAAADITITLLENKLDKDFFEAGKGSTIKWENKDSMTHTISFSKTPEGVSIKDQAIEGGKSWSKKFDKSGEYSYSFVETSYVMGSIVIE